VKRAFVVVFVFMADSAQQLTVLVTCVAKLQRREEDFEG
jgi:hypothetical protein